ncbi:RapGeF [Acrasis kona]|uniref:RapGeF n=1 Tax=Acrasis kona TaxID=1008807 RepID=A0AAW2ZSL7_9EUKA
MIGTVPKSLEKPTFQPVDFLSDTIVDKDLQWCFKVAEDSHDWITTSDFNNEVNVCDHFDSYVSRRSYSIGDCGTKNGVILVKFTGVVPYNIDQVLPTWNDHDCERFIQDNFINHSYLYSTQRKDEDSYSCSVIHSIVDMGPYLQTRDVVVNVTQVYDTERNCYARLSKSTFCRTRPPSADHVRGQVLISHTVRELSENRSRYCRVMYFDAKCEVVSDSQLFKSQVHSQASLFHAGLLKALEYKDKKDSFETPEVTLGRAETLEDFMQHHVTSASSVKTWDTVVNQSENISVSALNPHSSFSLHIVSKSPSFVARRRPVHQKMGSGPEHMIDEMDILQYSHLCEIKSIVMTDIVENQLRRLMDDLKHPVSGLSLANRRYMLKNYVNCFIASEAITWFANQFSCSRPNAMRIATFVQRRGLIDHVTNQHIIKDSYLFFKFVDEPHTDGFDWSPSTRKNVFKIKSTHRRILTLPWSSGTVNNATSPSSPPRYDNKIKAQLSTTSLNRKVYDQIFDSRGPVATICLMIQSVEKLPGMIDYNNHGLSELNPYCMIEIGGKVHQTTPKTGHSPVWNDTHNFNVSDLPVTCNIVVLDKDKDTFFGKMIGHVSTEINSSSGTLISLPLILNDELKKKSSEVPLMTIKFSCL